MELSIEEVQYLKGKIENKEKDLDKYRIIRRNI